MLRRHRRVHLSVWLVLTGPLPALLAGILLLRLTDPRAAPPELLPPEPSPEMSR
jgi:hypothetical protein